MARRAKAKTPRPTLLQRLHEAEVNLDEAWFSAARTQRNYYNERQLTMKLTGQLANAKRRIAKLQIRLARAGL